MIIKKESNIIRNFATWSCLTVNLLNIPPCVNISGFFLVIDRRYGHTTTTMATGASASVVAIVGVVFTVIGKTNLFALFSNAFLIKKSGKQDSLFLISRFASLQASDFLLYLSLDINASAV